MDGFIDNNPAVRNKIVNGVPYQTFVIIIDHITIFGSESHAIDENPKYSSR